MATLLEYRGHIRNWETLCAELGVDPESEAKKREEEILIAAYEKWGADMPNHLYGMFALTIRDDENDLIYGLRDQFGTKPYYYYVTEDRKLLSSLSIRTILKQDGFVKEFNPDMLQLFLTYTYVPGEDTFFKGLKKLMPGHYLTFRDGKLEIARYWVPEFKPDESKSCEDILFRLAGCGVFRRCGLFICAGYVRCGGG